jgi:hypothetical protein
MALRCRLLCWGRATAYVRHKPHTAPLWGRACSQNPEHTLTCMVFSHFAIYLKFMHVEHNVVAKYGECTVFSHFAIP